MLLVRFACKCRLRRDSGKVLIKNREISGANARLDRPPVGCVVVDETKLRRSCRCTLVPNRNPKLFRLNYPPANLANRFVTQRAATPYQNWRETGSPGRQLHGLSAGPSCLTINDRTILCNAYYARYP